MQDVKSNLKDEKVSKSCCNEKKFQFQHINLVTIMQKFC